TLLREVIGDLLDIDSRLWRSLIPLIFRPGHLTAEYLRGRRVQYIPPFRLYLVLSLIFFLLNSIDDDRRFIAIVDDTTIELREEVKVEVEETEGEAFSCDDITVDISPPWLARIVNREKAKNICLTAQHDPQRFLDGLLENMPAMMFVFLPLIAWVMDLLYIRTSRYYVEHLLFVVHYHALTFLLMSLGGVIYLLSGWITVLEGASSAVNTAVSLYLPVYLHLALRRIYGKRLLTLRYIVLIIVYMVCLVITLLSTLAYTALSL
ncbi:MAG: DUF3667 domain-containing protein, partial [Pseudomonadales bacterium]